ncbi:F-box domain [Ceraceosorus bombacis]|uniref:F-box domain n=1 Tax=Ceraceosorus bombacis TaxID=401625 RepID=A0A0P1BGF1_9BASI|nr:F-box domain [Ceraceosorus bombacis]
MQTLPVEIFRQIMVHADPRAVYLSRRVCMLWKRLIDADQHIWSSVAYQWRLVSSANSPLPPCISELPLSSGDDGSEPYQIWSAPRLPYSYYRARTHLHGVDSLKNLCSVHVSLTENWEEARDFLIHTCLQEEVGTLPLPPSESIRRVRGKSSSLYELVEVDDGQIMPLIWAVETWKWSGGRKKMINRVRLPGRKHKTDCLCIRFPYCVTFVRATRNRQQLIYWDILSPSDPVVLETMLIFPSHISKLDFDLEAQIVIVTSGDHTLVQSLRDGSVLSYVMARPSAVLSEWYDDGTEDPTALAFDMILGSLDIAVGTIYLDPGSHTKKRGPLVPTIIEWKTMPCQKANANSDPGKPQPFNLWTFKDRLERCQCTYRWTGRLIPSL